MQQTDSAHVPSSTSYPTEHPKRVLIQPKNIPDELKQLNRWLVWRYIWDANKTRKDGSGLKGDWTKPPFDYKSHYRGDGTNPANWTTFDHALKVWEQYEYDGIG